MHRCEPLHIIDFTHPLIYGAGNKDPWNLFMSGDSTTSEWDTEFTGPTDSSLITDISRTITNLSSENRAKRRGRKLREELVREHIEEKQRSGSRLKSIFVKLFKS